MSKVISKRTVFDVVARYVCICGAVVEYDKDDLRSRYEVGDNYSYVVCPECAVWIQDRDLKFKRRGRPKRKEWIPENIPVACSKCGEDLINMEGIEPFIVHLKVWPRKWSSVGADPIRISSSGPEIMTRYITKIEAVPSEIAIICPKCDKPHEVSVTAFELAWCDR